MDEGKENPPTNALTNGVTEDELMKAISKSGYPLQTLVAKQLLSAFSIQGEWVYVDSESQLKRTLDIMADRYLVDLSPPPAIVPNLTLLIECKKSELPVLFSFRTILRTAQTFLVCSVYRAAIFYLWARSQRTVFR